MYRDFLLELKEKRRARAYSLFELSRETRISKKIINKIENLDENEVDSFPQKHLLFLYAKHLGVDVPAKKISLNNEIENTPQFSNNSATLNFISLIINDIKFQIIFPLTIVIAILGFNYSLQNKNLSAEIKLDNFKISSPKNLEINNSQNSVDSNEYKNKEILNPSLNDTKQKVSMPSREQIADEETVSLSLKFDNEVWVEVDNSKEIIISQIFAKGEELSIEVLKKDEIFITTGNMGSISLKVGDNQSKFLGSKGEIGRKQIF